MSDSGTVQSVDLQDMRVKLYDLLGHSYAAVSPSPASMMLLQVAGMVSSENGMFRCRGRVRGLGFDGKRFCIQEVAAQKDDDETGFRGVILSLSHKLSLYGRTVILPDQGLLNPRHIDGMKRVGFPSSDFERAFETYADDQVEGRILTPPDFIERLMAFNPILTGGPASVAFAGRQMHVVLPTGKEFRFSDDRTFYHHDAAAEHIAGEMVKILDLVAKVDALQSSADRHCPIEKARARDDYYLSATQSVLPAVEAAMRAGIMTDHRRAKYLTRDATLIDPAFRGLLTPRV